MDDLTDLQHRLNSDPGLRAPFLKDPASLLQTSGLSLSPEQAQKLNASLTTLTTRPSAPSAPIFIAVHVDGR